jgi:antitoxin CcdA
MSEVRRTTKVVKVPIPAGLLEAARTFDTNSSASLEHPLRLHRREDWLAPNAEGIEAYNCDVEEHGSFGDTLRTF